SDLGDLGGNVEDLAAPQRVPRGPARAAAEAVGGAVANYRPSSMEGTLDHGNGDGDNARSGHEMRRVETHRGEAEQLRAVEVELALLNVALPVFSAGPARQQGAHESGVHPAGALHVNFTDNCGDSWLDDQRNRRLA